MIINYEARDSGKPEFLAGDINDTPGSKTLDLFSLSWENLSSTEYSFPADQPDRCIDYIFWLNLDGFNYRVLRKEMVNEPVASDHLPVFVDVIFE